MMQYLNGTKEMRENNMQLPFGKDGQNPITKAETMTMNQYGEDAHTISAQIAEEER